jgi:imidazoleglycerol phosphate dehydratase HisB
MISAFSKHGHIDVVLTCKGDLHIDDHHTAEDCALALGAQLSSQRMHCLQITSSHNLSSLSPRR